MLPIVAGCSSDPCRTLCTDVAVKIDACLPEWGVTWEELGAESRRSWRVSCQNDWDAVRADLEAREVPASEDQCNDASTELDTLSCDELRALYLD